MGEQRTFASMAWRHKSKVTRRERFLVLRAGTIVDATTIAAPSSTKNATATRDPEMKQTRKGNNWPSA